MGMRRFIEFTAPATSRGLQELSGTLANEFPDSVKVEYICIEYPLDKGPQIVVRFVDGD